MKTLAHGAMPPAVDGAGRAPIVDPAEVADWQAQLAEHPLLRNASSVGLADALRPLVRFTRYLAGYAVMSAGEAPDRVALVLAGRCRIWSPEDRSQTIAWVGAGDVLGEMSALTGERRSVTVGAVRDVVLAEFDLDTLQRLDDRLARLEIEAWLSRLVARRALGQEPRRPSSVALALLGDDPDVVQAAVELLSAAATESQIRCAVRTPADWPEAPSVQMLERVERDHDVLLLVGDRGDSIWTDRIVRQADRVLVVVDAVGDPRLTSSDVRADAARAPHVLVLLQPPDIERARDTARWLAERQPLMHLHLRRGNLADAARCIRLATGRGRGVAFAGASSRGLGYSGMLAAFEELSLQMDTIGGNSSGAMAAACLAAGLDSARTRAAYRAGLAAMRPNLRNVTLPLVALLTGARASLFFRRFFGDMRLEDLLLPCVITAVDLSTLALVELREGPVWRAVRASTSLPVYYPPVVDDAQVLVDGGVLQNVPVHPLMPSCRDGFIVVGDLSQDPQGMRDITPYGSAVSGWTLPFRWLWPFGRRPKYPLLPEVVFRTVCLASLSNQQALMADLDPSWVYVRPVTPSIGLFGATDTQIPRLIEDTREQTLAQLRASEQPAVRAALEP